MFNLVDVSCVIVQNHGGVILNISATLHYNGRVLQAHAGSAKAAIGLSLYLLLQ